MLYDTYERGWLKDVTLEDVKQVLFEAYEISLSWPKQIPVLLEYMCLTVRERTFLTEMWKPVSPFSPSRK